MGYLTWGSSTDLLVRQVELVHHLQHLLPARQLLGDRPGRPDHGPGRLALLLQQVRRLLRHVLLRAQDEGQSGEHMILFLSCKRYAASLRLQFSPHDNHSDGYLKHMILKPAPSTYK